jgi:hypothetical protein
MLNLSCFNIHGRSCRSVSIHGTSLSIGPANVIISAFLRTTNWLIISSSSFRTKWRSNKICRELNSRSERDCRKKKRRASTARSWMCANHVASFVAVRGLKDHIFSPVLARV